MSPHYYISLFARTLGVWDRLWEALIAEAWTKDDVARPYRSSLIAYYYSGMEGANTHAISKGTLLPHHILQGQLELNAHHLPFVLPSIQSLASRPVSRSTYSISMKSRQWNETGSIISGNEPLPHQNWPTFPALSWFVRYSFGHQWPTNERTNERVNVSPASNAGALSLPHVIHRIII